MAEPVDGPASATCQVVEVYHESQVLAAQSAARRIALAVGFAAADGENIVIAASELASNVARHGRGGTLSISMIDDGQRRGIMLVADDAGPGIIDPERALTDGFSTAGSLGVGLGTVHRLMDDLTFAESMQGGARVACRRWLPPALSQAFARELMFGVATRPRHEAPENGDAFTIKCWPGCALVGVIDGVGHGPDAERASQAARSYIESHFSLALEELFAGVERVCRGTRGVVMALARFELETRVLRYGSVGNIEARLLGSPDARTFIVRRGIIGLSAPKPVVTQHAWTPECTLILHSDGLRTHWDPTDFPPSTWASPAGAAETLLRALAREDDDATVVVTRSAEA
jgi:anti-sigma regulatory factor (Ser/Thr protein kinase)/serine/threonine protein phosphatase PrpC